jgi:bacterioferritin-associated ferredoxin
MYACICRAVTDEDVHAEACRGARTVRELAARSGAGTDCGSCVKRLTCLLAALREDQQTPQSA